MQTEEEHGVEHAHRENIEKLCSKESVSKTSNGLSRRENMDRLTDLWLQETSDRRKRE